jgi:translation initiation factor 3 subunit B
MEDRLDKLKNVIRKIMGKFGTIVGEYYPADENGQTKG